MLEHLKEIIMNYVEVNEEDITMDARFMEDLGFNSFDFTNMLGELEDALDIEIDLHKAAEIMTVEEMVGYLEEVCNEDL